MPGGEKPLGNYSGRSGRRWSRLKAEQRAKRLPCWLCGQAINYEASNPNEDDAFSVDHVKPWSTHPHLREDPTNLRSAHQKCNKRRNNRAPSPTIGDASEEW